MSAFLSLLEDVFRVRPQEAKKVLLAFGYLFFSISAFIASRIARTVLFLEIPNYREQLTLTYVGIAIAVSTVMYFYARVERKLRRDQTNSITLALIVGTTLLVRWLLEHPADSGLIAENPVHDVYWLFYIWVEIFGTLLIVQFWSFTNEIFHSRQAKRLFPIIGGGGVLANIAAGAAIRGIVDDIGTENLLYLVSGCLAAALVLVQMLGKVARSELNAAKERGPKKRAGGGGAKGQKIFATKHVQLIAALIVLTYLVSTMVDYQFNVIVGDSIPLKDERSAYYASFFLYTGIIGGFIQFFLTVRILERFGVLFALLLLPIFMLGGSIGLIAVPFTALTALWAAAITKGSENSLRYTINDSTVQLLYLPVPAHIRGRAKAVIDGILKPVSLGGAGLLMALLVGRLESLIGVSLGFTLDVFQLSWIVGGALGGWIVVLLVLRREYVKSLMQTLQRRRLNFDDSGFRITDESTVSTVRETLGSSDVGQVLHALELLPAVSEKARTPLRDRVVELLLHEAEEVRVAALRYLGKHSPEGVADDVVDFLSDPSDDVRAAAIFAYCAVMHEGSIERVHAMLDDDSHQVRTASLAGLIRYGGLDGVLASADVLKALLNSAVPSERSQAAWVLGEVGVQNFYQPLLPLLADDDERVRQSAIIAAGKLKSEPLIEALCEQLDRVRLAPGAAAALAAFGPRVEESVTEILKDTARAPAVRSYAAKVLSRLGTESACVTLMSELQDPTAQVRLTVAQAVVHVVKRDGTQHIDKALVRTALKTEAERWFNLMALELDIAASEESVLLADALQHRMRQAKSQILTLLALQYPGETIELVARNLESSTPATRANAVEVLDNLLHKDEKALIIPLLDDNSLEKTVQAGEVVCTIKRAPRRERLIELLEGPDPWLQTCAALEVGNSKEKKLENEVRTLLESPNAVCRETAISVLRQLNPNGSLKKQIEPLVDDPAKSVSRYAQYVMDGLAS